MVQARCRSTGSMDSAATVTDPHRQPRTMTEVRGHADEGWGRVVDAFRANFEQHRELGAAACVYANGRMVVDLWGGTADKGSREAWRKDTIVMVFSATKGATAICAHMLVERGVLDLDAPVVAYWPEFGTEGKGQIKFRWLLSHMAGLPVVDTPLTLQEACAWHPVIRALEAQRPLWTPGAQYMYHPKTWGFLVGEVVRRSTGKTLGRFFADEVAAPLNLSSWIGLPEEVESRLAHLELAPPPRDAKAMLATLGERLGLEPDAAREVAASWQAMVADPKSVSVRAGTLGGAFPQLVMEESGGKARAVRAAEFPSSNMVTDARSLARLYAGTIGEVDGVRLLSPSTVEQMCVVQTDRAQPYGLRPGTEPLADALAPPFALGFRTPTRLTPLLGPRSFGHPGAGGSMGFADPDAGIGFGYVMNRMASDVNEARASRLVAAISASLR
jgi:CubicO group peptidase (beta-lactamase class C family)